ncbi:MAG: type III toxin-antitoxin system ToxN/AbiQ family toxin [Bacteroides sp.]|nr:type III toxin-antitoxin system ToxN/AbiQ family toxin [Bacteroides sp.]
MKYIRNLSNVDDNVLSVSPQIGKENRPFVGVLLICGKKEYCVPLSSPKPKHEKMKNDKDFSKILDRDGKLIGVLNFNMMIPVDKRFIKLAHLDASKSDTDQIAEYKQLMRDQLAWCNANIDTIVRKANKLYELVTLTPEKSRNLTRRCCDFKKLEAVLDKMLLRDGSEEYIF